MGTSERVQEAKGEFEMMFVVHWNPKYHKGTRIEANSHKEAFQLSGEQDDPVENTKI